MFSGGFKRSGLFGLIGVLVVAAVVVAIALTIGSDPEADPQMLYGLIFGVLAIFIVILLVLQRADLNRVSGADARGTARGAAEGGRQVENPSYGRRWRSGRSTARQSRRAARCGSPAAAARTWRCW
jgi:hypothetical protein